MDQRECKKEDQQTKPPHRLECFLMREKNVPGIRSNCSKIAYFSLSSSNKTHLRIS
jgi:hypothetical protein